MSLKPIPNLDQFIGKELLFKVVNIDEEHHNIILSEQQGFGRRSRTEKTGIAGKNQIDSELDGK